MATDSMDGKSNALPGDVNLPDEPIPVALSSAPKTHLSSTHQRHGYRRMDSQGSVQLSPDVQASLSTSYSTIPSIMENGASDPDAVSQGLGISRMSSTRSRKSPSPPSPSSALQSPTLGSLVTSPATSQRPLLSPAWAQDTYYEGLDQGHARNEAVEEADISRGKISAFTESLDAAFDSVEEFATLNDLKAPVNHNGDGHDHSGCTSTQDIHSRGTSWLSVSVLILCIYSTIFSGIWFFIGVIRPRFRIIRTGGPLNPSTASIIFAIFAKTIELSFVTIFVTFLGQVLSRRSLVKTSSGVTVAELTMRTWVIQPGFMITNPKVLRTAGISVLGAITFTAAVVAMFYTTASDALVNPSLQLGHWHYKNMSGLVQSSFGNLNFVKQSCQTPIPNSTDPLYSAETCISIDHAGEAYHNFLEYNRIWAAINTPESKGNSSKLAERPNAKAMLYDNTTVTGTWVDTEYSDIAANYQKHNRIINNVTMAMPHAGVIAAASSHVNNILQPSDLDGVGEYNVRASVVSPAINIVCANMNASELSPLIYVDWPNAKTNSSDYPGQKFAWSGWQDEAQLQPGEDYLNSTVVDDIFGWRTTKNGLATQPPVFPMLPITYNIISNYSMPYSPYIYTLIKSNSTSDYTLCQLGGYLWPYCSTSYSASGKTGGALKTICNDPNDEMIYSKSEPDPPTNIQPDFKDIMSDWIFSMSLNTGVTNGNASIARLLSQFVVTTPEFNTRLPSLAEALASLVSCTLLLGAQSATFRHYWGYTGGPMLSTGVYEPFNATLASQEYQAGPQQPWQKIFYLVLILVFLTNLFCLTYFIRQRGLVTDFTATQNLFALAVNSPPSHRLGGSCGAGPEGEQLNVDFHIQCAEDSSHFYLKEGDGVYQDSGFELRNRKGKAPKGKAPKGKGPLTALKERTATTYSKLSNKRASIL